MVWLCFIMTILSYSVPTEYFVSLLLAKPFQQMCGLVRCLFTRLLSPAFLVTLIIWCMIADLPCSCQSATKKAKKRSWADLNNDIQKHPNDAWLYIQRGDASANGFEDRKAIRDYTKALELNPKIMFAYLRRGDALSNIGEFQKAEADYNRALEFASVSPDPTEVDMAGDAAVKLANRYQSRGENDKALALWKRVVGVTHNPKDLIRKGKCELALSLLDAARADLESGLKARPTDTEAMEILGECLERQGKHLEAIAEYSKAIDQINKAQLTFTIRHRSLLYENRAKSYDKIGKKDLAAQDRAKLRDSRDTFFDVVPFRDERIH